MAMTMEFGEKSRFTDVFDEPVDRLLSPIRGYEDEPLLPLTMTLSNLFHNFLMRFKIMFMLLYIILKIQLMDYINKNQLQFIFIQCSFTVDQIYMFYSINHYVMKIMVFIS